MYMNGMLLIALSSLRDWYHNNMIDQRLIALPLLQFATSIMLLLRLMGLLD
jgi:hypothetical protein